MTPSSILKKYWSYDQFRSPQEEIINDIVASKDVIALLPTGAGKSICFQVSGVVRDGFTLVISPLVALMEDQVNQLNKRGLKSVFLHSGMTKRELDIALDNVIYGNYQFLYISPERIHSEIFVARLSKMKISLIAIDEAHCISQWGHDFRPAYLELIKLREYFTSVPLAAFTATATKETLEDIKSYLGFDQYEFYRKSFKKENLSYNVIKTSDKMRECFYLIARLSGSGIIYVRSRRYAEVLSKELNKNGHDSQFYHAGLSYKDRKKKADQWLSGDKRIMISTNAFGMGIDKPDVRWVVHMDIPGSLEEYYQEAGRAGRDGLFSHAVMVYDDKDEERAFSNLELSQVNHLIINHVYDKLCRFLMVPIGAGENQTYNFDVNLFSKKYNIPIRKAISVIEILEQAEILRASDGFYRPSQLMLNSNKELVFRENKNDTPFGQFLLALVRNYEGLFTRYVKINEAQVARFANLKIEAVSKYLDTINELGIGFFQKSNSDAQIIFLSPRTEAKSLPIDYARIDRLFEVRWNKLEAMMNFVHADDCREEHVLHYFSEKKTDKCTQCDVCKGSTNASFNSPELKALYKYLSKKISNESQVSIFDLLHWWPHNKRNKVLAMLSILENEKKIILENRAIRVL